MLTTRRWLLLAVVLAACASEPATTTATTATTSSTTTVASTTTTGTTTATVAVEIALRIEDRTGTEPGFAEEVRAILADARGWSRAGFAFVFDDPDAPYVVLLAEAAEVDELCRPYDTFGRYSCQIGPVVALNADRWRSATPEWPADLASYRQMLVNHEVGHLLGQHHIRPPCEAAGEPAAIMAQQSTELPGTGCRPNPWPLDWEIGCAARHDEPLAPPYEVSPEASCLAHR